jgi:hypothetical protein
MSFELFVCLFLWIVCLSHLKMVVAEQSVNIKFCVLLQKWPSETLQMLEEAYGIVEVKKMQVLRMV